MSKLSNTNQLRHCQEPLTLTWKLCDGSNEAWSWRQSVNGSIQVPVIFHILCVYCKCSGLRVKCFQSEMCIKQPHVAKINNVLRSYHFLPVYTTRLFFYVHIISFVVDSVEGGIIHSECERMFSLFSQNITDAARPFGNLRLLGRSCFVDLTHQVEKYLQTEKSHIFT